MSSNRSCTPTVIRAALMVALAGGSLPLFAQTAGSDVEEVIVVAPRVTQEQQRFIGSSPVTTEKALDATVHYADLDLRLTADVRELQRRVELAANQACEQLAADVPIGEPRVSGCVRDAVREAMAQVDKAVGKQVELVGW